MQIITLKQAIGLSCKISLIDKNARVGWKKMHQSKGFNDDKNMSNRHGNVSEEGRSAADGKSRAVPTGSGWLHWAETATNTSCNNGNHRFISVNSLKEKMEHQPFSTLIIDCRVRRHYEEACIALSINVDTLHTTNLKLLNNLDDVEKRYFTHYHDIMLFKQREHVECIVLYGCDDEDDAVFKFPYSGPIFEKTLILRGGFNQFKDHFPQFCFNRDELMNYHAEKECIGRVVPSMKERLSHAHKLIFKNLSKNIDCENPTKISCDLYLGSAQNSINGHQLCELGITHIVNAAKECPNHFEERLIYLNIPVLDYEEEDILQYFDKCFAFVEQAKSEKKKILIHCFMGMSRSVCLVLACLMKFKDWSLKKSYQYVLKKRPIIDINLGFMKQLKRFEQILKEKQKAANEERRRPASPPEKSATSIMSAICSSTNNVSPSTPPSDSYFLNYYRTFYEFSDSPEKSQDTTSPTTNNNLTASSGSILFDDIASPYATSPILSFKDVFIIKGKHTSQ